MPEASQGASPPGPLGSSQHPQLAGKGLIAGKTLKPHEKFQTSQKFSDSTKKNIIPPTNFQN